MRNCAGLSRLKIVGQSELPQTARAYNNFSPGIGLQSAGKPVSPASVCQAGSNSGLAHSKPQYWVIDSKRCSTALKSTGFTM